MLHSERLPVADNLTTCLNKAIDVVKSVEGLDDDAQTLIVDRLRKAARNKELSDEDRIISVEQAILNARRDIVQAAVARKRQTEVLEGWAEDSRFRFGEGADELETAATNFKRLISADRGNQGIANESTVAAELRFELRQVLGRLEPVFRGIVDTRGYLRDSELAVKFHAETVGVDTGNAEAKRLAGLFHEAMQPYLERLQEAGIPTAVHYPKPLNEQPAYAHLCCPDCTPVAQQFSENVISLPMHPRLTTADQDRVINELRNVSVTGGHG